MESTLEYGSYYDRDNTKRLEHGSDWRRRSTGGNKNFGSQEYGYIAKTIFINSENVPWMGDYMVDISYLNCFPVEFGMNGTSHFIDKKKDRFTIYIPVSLPSDTFSEDLYNGPNKTFAAVRNLEYNNGSFYVLSEDMETGIGAKAKQYKGAPTKGVCLYPSISFTVTGLATNAHNNTVNLGINPNLTLR